VVRRAGERGAAGRRAVGKHSAAACERGRMETSGFSPTLFRSFPAVLIPVRTSFLNQEIVSSYLALSPHLLTCHVIFSTYVASNLMKIETTINTH
jgi:hypothetical protein